MLCYSCIGTVLDEVQLSNAFMVLVTRMSVINQQALTLVCVTLVCQYYYLSSPRIRSEPRNFKFSISYTGDILGNIFG